MNTITNASRAFHFGTAALLIILTGFILSGCSGIQVNVIGGCELPAVLDTHDTVEDLPPLIPPDQIGPLWAKDRAHLAKSVKHGNDTVDYVKAHCK